MGVFLGSAVVPIALCITWSKANKWGCVSGAIAGLVAGIIAWMVTTSQLNSVINVQTSGGDYEMLAGNLAAIGVGGIISVVISYLVCFFSISSAILTQPFRSAQIPEDFNFDITRAINAPVHHHVKAEHEDERKSSTEKVNTEKVDEKADVHSVAQSSVRLGI